MSEGKKYSVPHDELHLSDSAAVAYENYNDVILDPEKQGQYTVDDLEALPDDVRAELIDGYIYMMSAPRSIHQRMISKLVQYFENFIDDNGGDCRVEPGVGVYIDDDEDSEMIPDISIVCDPSKDDGKSIHGAPDLVIEILSPSTRSYDLSKKLAKYVSSGVRECWMIDIYKRKVIIYDNTHPDELHPDISIYGFGDKVPVAIYDGKLTIDFAKIISSLGL